MADRLTIAELEALLETDAGAFVEIAPDGTIRQRENPAPAAVPLTRRLDLGGTY